MLSAIDLGSFPLAVGEPSAWRFGWEALVAIGTIGLAGVTAFLAWTTRQVARATQSEIAAGWRPVLTLVDSAWLDRRPMPMQPGSFRPIWPLLSLTDTYLIVTAVNTGAGPAVGVAIKFDRFSHPWIEPDGKAIAPGEPTSFELKTGQEAPFPSGTTGTIRYSDLADTIYETSFEIARHGAKGAVVLRQSTRRVPG